MILSTFIGSKVRKVDIMKGIITVVGEDKVGIIAEICTVLAERNVNILDISQTIIQGYFNMMMVVDITKLELEFNSLVDELKVIGDKKEVIVNLQHENIFKSMHRI